MGVRTLEEMGVREDANIKKSEDHGRKESANNARDITQTRIYSCESPPLPLINAETFSLDS